MGLVTSSLSRCLFRADSGPSEECQSPATLLHPHDFAIEVFSCIFFSMESQDFFLNTKKINKF